MKNIFTLFLFLSALYTYAQCDGIRYETPLFDEVEVSSDIIYGANTNIYNIVEDLKMDVYEPIGDTVSDRALIIFAHGGSFVVGDKADPSMVLIGTDFAKMGYVTCSINYRLGITTNPIIDLPDSASSLAAIIRGVHDFKAAMRWFQQDAIDGENQFNIDPEKVFIAGFSAGGFIVLHHAYLDEESEWPEFESDVLGVDGGIEGNSGNPGYSTDFLAGLSAAGAIGDTSWINAGDEPMMSTHGTEDDVVPYGTAMLSFSLGSLTINIAVVHGSSVVHERLDEVGVANCFTSYEGQGHVPESDLGSYYDTTFVKTKNFFVSILCDDEINCDYDDLVGGIEDYTSSNKIRVYPNPFNDKITFTDNNMLQVRSIYLYDLKGQTIQQWDQPRSNTIEVNDVKTGIYFLRIQEENGNSTTLKIVKQ